MSYDNLGQEYIEEEARASAAYHEACQKEPAKWRDHLEAYSLRRAELAAKYDKRMKRN